MLQRLLILSIFIPLALSVTCPSQFDGRKCAKSSDCQDQNKKCFFGNENPLGSGVCCEVKDNHYYNAMFELLIDDPNARIPVDLFYPVREDSCKDSKDCMYSEVCMVSRRIGNYSNIPLSLPISEYHQIEKRCFNKLPHWTTIYGSYSVLFCNSSSNCYNNNNCHLFHEQVIETIIKMNWKTENVTIYHPYNNGKRFHVVEKAVLKMQEEDRMKEHWLLDISNTDMYSWVPKDKLKRCSFYFQGNPVMTNIKTPARVRGATLACLDLEENFKEDLEIFGGDVTIEITHLSHQGVCGHPNLNCSDCLINGRLFRCSTDSDCYKIGDDEWTNRNEKAFCSDEKYNGERLCKRELFTCPPDSLNSDGTGSCQEDEDCKTMATFTEFSDKNEKWFPHCFNGACCARRHLCKRHDLPYALPLESNALRVPKPCHSDEVCTMFKDAIGTCIFDESVSNVFKEREKEYLNTSTTAKKKSYGMCCYTRENVCVEGGFPIKDDFLSSICSTQSECNPELPPHKWKAYCSKPTEKDSSSCCKDKSENILCPDGFTPFRTEPKCEGFVPGLDETGICTNKTGICYKGHCCPGLKFLGKESIPADKNYLTETPCDTTQPLDMVYQWSYCDKNTERVMVMGSKKSNGEELDWQKKRCLVDSDCGHQMYICVHKFYGLKFCVVSPDWNTEINQYDLWQLTYVVLAIFCGILIIFVFMPVPIYG